jgi:hypothetical protein
MKTNPIVLAASLLNSLILFGNISFAGTTSRCPESHFAAIERILDDEGLGGSLGDGNRQSLNQWAIEKIDRYAAKCTDEAAMESYGLAVRDGMRRLVWDLEAGYWRHVRWLRRHGVISTAELRKLTAIQLGRSADRNAILALRVLRGG